MQLKRRENKHADKFGEQTSKKITLLMQREKNQLRVYVDRLVQSVEDKKSLLSCLYLVSYINYYHEEKEEYELYQSVWQH